MRIAVRGAVVVALAAVALAGCGGGGGGGGVTTPPPLEATACGQSRAEVSYPEVARTAVWPYPSESPTFAVAAVGSPFDAGLPSLTGVDSRCAASVRFRLSSGQLPPGLQLEFTTGRIHGTPTAAGSYAFVVDSITDAGVIVHTDFKANVADPSVFTIRAWTAMEQPLLRFSNIQVIANRLFQLQDGASPEAGASGLLVSDDRGATWQPVAAPLPWPGRSATASTDDGNAIYFSGGLQDTIPRHDVWKFDGIAWQRRTESAGLSYQLDGIWHYSHDYEMVKVQDALFVLGGDSVRWAPGPRTVFAASDVWKSLDDGVTWTRLPSPFEGRRVLCAVAFQGRLVAVTRTDFARAAIIWDSTDGIAWNRRDVSTSLALRELGFRESLFSSGLKPARCASANGRLYVVGANSGSSAAVVSSADLSNWQFEASIPDIAPSGPGVVARVTGVAALGGRLYVTTFAEQDGAIVRSRTYESVP